MGCCGSTSSAPRDEGCDGGHNPADTPDPAPDAATVVSAPQPIAEQVPHRGPKRVLVLRNAVTGASSFSNRGIESTLRSLRATVDGVDIVQRDLVKDPVPFLTEETCKAICDNVTETEAQQAASTLSAMLIDELKAADLVIIGLPRYNFGVPTSFKAYIDYVARRNFTFKDTDEGPVGILPDVPVWCIMSAGAVYGDDYYQESIRDTLNLLGLKTVKYLRIEGSAMLKEADIFTSFQGTLLEEMKHVNNIPCKA